MTVAYKNDTDAERIQAEAAALRALRELGVELDQIKAVEVRFNGGRPDVSFHALSGSRTQGVGYLFFMDHLKSLLSDADRNFI